ncbi:hypothetical protein MPTK1_4g09420 [Marchantia polymorpha subsp. ruderalis]|uniref:Uncharacterized protein n=2 Tax=Marchantia polymorpha TaxID=3197 RepID=A0AAF6B835_MARPO|nr:hypothetical protein MARPO_0112s0042 [Marchantia polymorpha]BBN08169.1 hypothetical protein Mp_4g09420 [Marchantia polymorpha subsp. ruderalis]|eukprot:PTQ31394.1 hypothetical protein MARPO_0112s0042 [Marchantia polymorpha]
MISYLGHLKLYPDTVFPNGVPQSETAAQYKRLGNKPYETLSSVGHRPFPFPSRSMRRTYKAIRTESRSLRFVCLVVGRAPSVTANTAAPAYSL